MFASQRHLFILGKYAYMYPDIIREIAADGHEFGNHSFFHPLFTAIPPITVTQEITYTEAAIDWAVGRHVPMRYIRFPYGGRNDAIRLHAASLGYQSAFWDLDPRGWEPDKTAEDVVKANMFARQQHGAQWRYRHHALRVLGRRKRLAVRTCSPVIRAIRKKSLSSLSERTCSPVITEQDRNIPDHPSCGQITPRTCSPSSPQK